MKRVLLVEDEEALAASLVQGLTEEGYRVDHIADGIAAEVSALTDDYDLLIVDWELPGQSGKALVQRIRARQSRVPILMLTARGTVTDRIAGLDAGADDYLTKPFSYEELLARFRALLRRPPALVDPETLSLGALRIDLDRREAHARDALLTLRRKEYDLLCLFLKAPGRVLTRTTIAEHVWGDIFGVSDNVIDVTVSGLRRKLQAAVKTSPPDPTDLPVLETLHGVGYRMRLSSPSS